MLKQPDKRKRMKFAIIFTSSLIVLWFMVAISTMSDTHYHKHKMIESISVLDCLSSYVVDDIESDEGLFDVSEPVQSFCKKIRWNGKRFDVYAYEFTDTQNCKKYIKNKTRRTAAQDKGFYMYGNIFLSSEYVIWDENTVLYIKGPGVKKMHEFLIFLTGQETGSVNPA